MKNIKHIYNSLSLLVLVILASCGYEPEVERAGLRSDLNTVQILDVNGYTILNEAIVHAGLEDVLLDADSVTLFAPSDAAFVALLDELGVSSITDVPAATVADILSYHVATSPVRLASLPRKVSTLSGDEAYIVGGSINGKAVISDTELASSNTIILGINKVLTVPSGNLFQQMQANDSLSVLVSAITSAGIQSLFTGAAEYTVFAPTNAAFNGVDVGALTAAQLVEILSFHVVAGVTFSQELPESAKVATILGTEADDNVQELIVDGGTINGNAVVSNNIVANNGVIHVLDGIIAKSLELNDVFDPSVNATTFDTFGFDSFGDVVIKSGYQAFDVLSNNYSIYAPFRGPDYASFASDEAAIAYIKSRTFEGIQNIWTVANGTKVTAIDGSSYYMQTAANGFTYMHTGARNAFSGNATSFSFYNGLAALPSGPFVALPEANLLEVLQQTAAYELFAALVVKLGKDELLTSGEATVFTVDNSVITAQTGISTTAQINALSEEDDAALLAALSAIVDDHIVSGVNFSIHISSFLPDLDTQSGNILDFALVAGDPVIIIDADLPDTENVGLVNVDITASNGAIHEVSDLIIL